MTNKRPNLSIIMPAYNAQLYIKDSIDSLLKQTFQDFELIVINDGSTDDTALIVEQYGDPRVKLFTMPSNSGAPNCRNYGIAKSRGKFISIHDADDISTPSRFEEQLSFMKVNKLDLTSTFVRPLRFKRRWKKGPTWRYETSCSLLRLRLLFDDPFVNSSVVMHRSLLLENDRETFLAEFDPCDDYEFYSYLILVKKIRFAIIPKVYLYYRQHGSQISFTRSEERLYNSQRVRRENFSRLARPVSKSVVDSFLQGVDLKSIEASDKVINYRLTRYMHSLNNLSRELKNDSMLLGSDVDIFIERCWYEKLAELVRCKRKVALRYWSLRSRGLKSYFIKGLFLYLMQIRYFTLP